MPERRTSQDRKQHLYLVFDDWNSGYSIRKVSLPHLSGKRPEQSLSSDSGEEYEQPAPLSSSRPGKGAKPLPVFMRFSAERGYPEFFTSAFGTKILMMLPGASGDIFDGVPTIDVQHQTLSFEPQPNCPAFPIFIPVSDDRLFALDMGTFDVLQKPEHSGGPWVWKKLTFPPFLLLDVSSYCVQPDGCILVSTKSGTTFIFNTKKYVWEKYGDWAFPFTGRGHYDPVLEGYVGLSKHPDTHGYLYCCTVASTTATGDVGTGLHPSPDFKCIKKRLCGAEEQHVSATLVHMHRGRFCIVECVSIGNRMTDQELDQELRAPPGTDQWDFVGGGPQCGRFMYRMMTLSLAYDTKGDLKLKDCKVHCYSLPHKARIGSICQDPVAFWL